MRFVPCSVSVGLSSLLLALGMIVSHSAEAQPQDAALPKYTFRVIGFGVEARNLYFVEGDEVRALELRDRLISDEIVFRGNMPLALYTEPPPLDDPDAAWPPIVLTLQWTADDNPRLIGIFPGTDQTEAYRRIILRDTSDRNAKGGTIRLYNFTPLNLGIKLGEKTDRVGPRSTIDWSNIEEKRRAFVVLVAEDPEDDELRPLRSGYVRLSPAARSLVFVLPGQGGAMDPLLVQIYDYL